MSTNDIAVVVPITIAAIASVLNVVLGLIELIARRNGVSPYESVQSRSRGASRSRFPANQTGKDAGA